MVTYVPDFTRQGRIDQSRKIYSLRLTTQISPREQVDAVLGRTAAVQRRGMAGSPATTAACRTRTAGSTVAARTTASSVLARTRRRPATTATRTRRCSRSKYTSPATNKLLLEAGFGTYISQWGYQERPGQSDEEPDSRAGTVGADLRSSGQQRCDRVRGLPHGRRQLEVPLVELADAVTSSRTRGTRRRAT